MDVLARDQNSSSSKLDECLIRYRSQSGDTREKTAGELSRLIAPLLLKYARNHMRSGSHGLDLCSPDDLAQAVWLNIFEKDEILAKAETGRGLLTYLSTMVKNYHIDDKRKLNGRTNALLQVNINGATDRTVGAALREILGVLREQNINCSVLNQEGGLITLKFRDEQARSMCKIEIEQRFSEYECVRNDNIPRVHLSDTPLLVGIESERRSQSGYAQLRKTKEILRRYLRQLPGKVVEIPTKVRSEHPSMKRVILTEKHADLLKLWMNPDNEDASWDELAESIGKPVGTIKRWFSEVTVHLCTDPDSDADSLRKDYGIKEPFRSNEDE